MSSAKWLLVLALGGACGASEQEAGFEIAIPWIAAQECQNSNGLAGMEAVLRVGDHTDECALSVNPDLTIHGSCEEITVGIVRPLVLVYLLRDSMKPPAPLVYDIGWVDLRQQALGDQATVKVALGKNDGINSHMVYTPSEINALPGLQATTITNLEMAEQWAKDQIKIKGETLDRDCDGIPNLTEVCVGGVSRLFEDECP